MAQSMVVGQPLEGTMSRADRLAVGAWLLCVAALIFIMVVVGGATRLTDSGLSITEWRPVTGAIPPLSAADWASEFEKYRQIPEYQQINRGMSLDEFKFIYWWEWGHRFLGRLIGAAFLLPFLWFLIRGRIERTLVPRLTFIFVLGGLQGAMGWYMVMSGLVDRVDVSQYRLTAHLGLATLLFAMILWTSLDLLQPRDAVAPRERGRSLFAWAIVGLIGFQILLGGFVAGLDAGLTYNTWPLMDGRLIPDGLFMQSPWWLNFFENITTVQFDHRIGAYLLTGAVVAHWFMIRRGETSGRVRLSADLLLAAVCAQVLLGIWTLLAVVPITLGALHQAGAIVLLGVALWHAHLLRQPVAVNQALNA